MKKRKVLIVCCAFLLLFGLSFKKVNAQESKVVYVNSEESKLEWNGLKNVIGYDSTLIDDGQYEAGKPGEYTVKFKDSSGEEKQVKVVVVQSEGTIKSIRPYGVNIFEVDESFVDGDSLTIGEKLFVNEKVIITIEKDDGTLEDKVTGIVNDCSGAGGGPLEDGSIIFSTSYCPVGGMNGRHNPQTMDEVKYYNPVDSKTGDNVYIMYYAIYYANRINQTITSKNDDIKIETYVSPMSGKIKINSTDLSIDDKVKETLKTSNYKAISLSLTDDSNQVYQVNEKTKISYKLDSRYDKNKVAVYQLKDDKITLLENKVEGDYVVFEAPILPGQYIIAEKAKEELITPPAINDESPKEETKKSDIVKTSDISWGVYVGLMVVSLGYILILRMKIRE